MKKAIKLRLDVKKIHKQVKKIINREQSDLITNCIL